MGVVYKARHPTLDMIVAVKTISTSLDATPEIRQRFHVEARSAAQLSHENIIRIYDYDEYKGKAYLVLEFLEGSDLKAEIKKVKEKQRPPFSLNQSLQIMMGVCKGLAHAHERGIYHRDIKPANIFLTNSGQVKILDFGLAKIVSEQVTMASAQMGTVAYMSPEQIDGKPIDQRSDIFSTSVVFYELLTYSQPFTGETWSEIFFKITQADPKPVETINKLIPAELSAIIQRGLAKDRNKRYQHMQELQDDLDYFRQELEVRKRELQTEARSVIGRLEKLIEENQDLLKERAAQLKAVKQDPPTVLVQLGVAAGPGELDRRAGFTLDYWEVAEICERAKQEYDQLSAIVQKREHFTRLLAEAETLTQKGDLVRALEIVESILRDAPSHSNALALKEQISARLKETRTEAKKQERAQEFLKLAETSFAAEDFTGCIAFAAEVLKLIPNHRQAISLLEQAQHRIKEEAEREEARRNAEKELAAAREALIAGDFNKARAAAENALEFCPDSQEASNMLLEIESAEQKYRERMAKQKIVADLLLEARALQNSGKVEAALDRIKQILAIEPDHHSAIALRDRVQELLRAQQRSDELFRLAAEKYASDDLTGCFPLLTEALKLRPEHPSAKVLLERTKEKIKERAQREEKRRQGMAALDHARAAFAQGDLQGARNEIVIIEKEYPDVPGISDLRDQIQRMEEELQAKKELQLKIEDLLRKAQSHLQAGEEDSALQTLNELRKMAPESAKAAELAAEIERRRQTRERELRERRDRIAKIFSQAQEAESTGDLKKAGNLAESILAQDISHSGARDLIARVEAEIIRRQRQEEEQRHRIAGLLKTVDEARSAGQHEKALHALDDILAIDKKRQDLLELRNSIQAQLEAEKARQARYAQAMQQKRIGLEFVKQSRYGDGLAALQSAREVLNDDPEVLSAIAEAEQGIRAKELQRMIQTALSESRKALARESYVEATERVSEVLLLDPGNEEARELRILVEEAQSRQQVRDKIVSYLAASRQALSKEDFVEATQFASKVLLLEPENSEARDLVDRIDKVRQQKLTREKIASLLAQSGNALSSENFEEADARAREILLLDPGNAEARELIQQIQTAHDQWHVKKRVTSLLADARSNWGRGQLEKAVHDLEEALQLDSGNKNVDSLLKKVEEDIRLQDEKRKRERIEEFFEQAKEAKAQARFSDAIQLLDEILLLDSSRRDIKELRRQIIAELDADKARQLKIAEAEREKQQGFKMLAQKRYQESLAALNHVKEVLGAEPDLEAAIAEAEAGLKSLELYSRIQADLAAARHALRTERLDKAVELANAVLYLDPQNAAGQELLNQIDRMREQKERTDRIAELLASIRGEMGKEEFDRAAQFAAQVLLLDPQNLEAKDLLKRIEGMQEQKNRRTRIAALLAQSHEALSRHGYEEAEAKAREVLLVDPQNAEAGSVLENINQAQGKRHLENRITELLIQADSARENQQFAAAMNKIEEVLQLDPRCKEARSLSKRIEKERRAFEKQRLRQAKEAVSDETVRIRKPVVSLARILKVATGTVIFVLVLFLIKTIIPWGPPEDDSYSRQVKICFEKGKYQAARQILTTWLQQHRENSKAKTMLADTDSVISELDSYESAKNQGNYARAADALRKIAKINAADPDLPQRWRELDEIFSQEFQDPFLGGLDAWSAPSTWKATNGRLSVGNGVGLINARHYKDFEADFNVQFARGDTASWILRAPDDKNYYLFQLTGPKGVPRNSFSGYTIRNGKVVKTILQPIGVALNLGKPNAQFRIELRAQGTKITHYFSSPTSPEEPRQGPYEVFDNSYSGGSFGFAAENNIEFSVFGPVIVYPSANSPRQ